ncbi:hypothetical protein [Paenibacillus sp. MMS18-CY102]|uniref:hypothetical protein n=1 Tax=Paenibacillus sp. MMS18-CY102 TaxID=2682849 RepID=UPI0013653457|nr:hypothetical protein [Paenibacillus sp. MMS18-CY102]MWC27002.1 hypothetical protein [Paenibacillus sp. MMS18-CY102]
MLELINMRDSIATINLKCLFNNTKKAMMSLHFLTFLIKFHQSEFSNFKSAIYYTGEEKDFMLGIKQGKMNKNEFLELLQEIENKARNLEPVFYNSQLNLQTKTKLQPLQ